MFYKTILWFVILVNFTPLNAQQNFSDFKVNFNVGEYVLDNADIETLKTLISEAKLAGYYEMTLSAHTDNDGSSSYNVSLSNKRANAVKEYLILNGLNEQVMDIDWFGESKPEASNESAEGKSINRRVTITLKKYKLDDVQDVLQSTGGNYIQTFTLNNKVDNTIQGKNGTTFFLPKDALMTADGHVVSSENITIELQEFQSGHDAIFNQLSTTCEGRILESGGMFSITAKYNGEDLKLKEGKSIDIEMPSANIKKDMQIFTGVKNADGITEWKTTSKPFAVRSKKKVEMPSVKLNSEYLKSLKQPVNFSKLKKVEKRYVLPKSKSRPRAPHKARLTEYPTEQQFFTRTQRLFMSQSKRDKMLAKEYDRIDKRNNRKTERYNKNMEIYETLLLRYPNDSIFYLNNQEKFYQWVQEQRKNCNDEITEYEKMGFNRALEKLISRNDNNGIKEALTVDVLSNNIAYDEDERERMLALYRMAFQLDHVLDLEFYQVVKYYSVNGVFDLDREPSEKEHTVKNVSFTYRMGGNFFAINYFKTDPKLKEAFATANLELLNKRSKLGLTDFNTLNSIYTASINGFGSINCDRFSNTPPEQMVNVEIECEGNSQISFFLPAINSYIYAHKNSITNVYEVRLPKGSQTTMLVVGVEEGFPVFLKQKLQVKDKMNLVATPLPATLKQIHNEVASI